MNSYITLTKTFISAISMSAPQDKRRKILVTVLSIFCIFGVWIPIALLMGVLVNLITKALMTAGIDVYGIQFMLHIISIFTLLFGINVIFNEFYFSNDIEYLLPWPLKARQIVAAKYTAAVFNENIMQCTLVLSCVIGYGLATGMNLFGWLISIIGIITLPILPMAYCAIISIIVMGFTRIIKNKDVIQKMTVLIMMALVVLIVVAMSSMQEFDIDAFAMELAAGEQGFFNMMNYIFPNVSLYVMAFAHNDMWALLWYILVNVAAVVIMLVLADLLYFGGVIGLNSNASGKKAKSLDKVLAGVKVKSPFVSLWLKEVRILLRTPVYLTNCVGVNFIWPVFVYAICKMQQNKITVDGLKMAYAANETVISLIFVVGIVALSAIITALNSISSGAISREGKHFAFMKYIPVDYKVQWNVKALVGVVFPFAGIVVWLIPAAVVLKIPVLHTVLYVVLTLLTTAFISYMGVYIDAIQPKLIWDDEMSVLRENFNTFFGMGIAMLIAAIISVVGIVFYLNCGRNVVTTGLILAVILLAALGGILGLTAKNGAYYIASQEEC